MQATISSTERSNRSRMAAGGTTALLILALGATACTASEESLRPPENVLTFPSGLVVAPDESVAFVTNANSELRYNSGSIVVLELEIIDQVVAAWAASRAVPDGCFEDPDHLETLVCDESLFIRTLAGVRIGNFATDLAAQDLGNGGLRLFVPTRGDPSVAWADWNGSQLSCSASADYGLCDDDHRLTSVHGDSEVATLPEEPFGVFADSAGEFAVVTHLSTGAVTLIDSPRAGSAQISDIVGGVFQADPATGLRGATGVVGRTPNASDDIVYVASRTDDRIQTFTVGRPVNFAPPYLLAGSYFFLESVGPPGIAGSSDSRGLAFSGSGERFYAVNRRPPSLQIFDTSIGPTGVPRNQPIGAVDICRQGSTVAVADAGDGERAYVTCFQDGQLYIIDPRGLSRLEDILIVGRGPYATSASATRKKLFVTNFLEDTIAVVDIAPGSPLRNRVVLRIGEPRAL